MATAFSRPRATTMRNVGMIGVGLAAGGAFWLYAHGSNDELKRIEAELLSAEATIEVLEPRLERAHSAIAGYIARLKILRERIDSLKASIAAARASKPDGE